MLLAAVRSTENQEKINPENIIPFSKSQGFIEFTAENNGNLVLTVNDIWLDFEKKDVYVPTLNEDTFQHYLQLAKFEAAFRGDFDSWSKKTKLEKAEEQHDKRKKDWNTIVRDKNWNIWYDDNIGSFSVSITVNPEME